MKPVATKPKVSREMTALTLCNWGLTEIPFFKTAKLHDLKNKGATKQSKTHKRQKVQFSWDYIYWTLTSQHSVKTREREAKLISRFSRFSTEDFVSMSIASFSSLYFPFKICHNLNNKQSVSECKLHKRSVKLCIITHPQYYKCCTLEKTPSLVSKAVRKCFHLYTD